MPLRAIAYVSRALPELSAERLQALVDDAARFNKMAGVTGVLLHDGGRFLQYIEGPPDGIDSVYERILQAGEDWEAQRMGHVPGETEFIPLPDHPFKTQRATSAVAPNPSNTSSGNG